MRRTTSSSMGLKCRLRRFAAAICWACTALLVLTPSALAEKAYGRGLWGVMNDTVVTYFGFIMIVGFPLLLLVLSLIQWRLDKRKEARKAAEKASLGEAYWHGGW